MPWNDPNKKPEDPWNSGQQPPDLDEVFRNIRNRVSALFGGKPRGPSAPGGGGSGVGLVILFVGIAAIGWMLLSSVHIIDEPERGVVLRFGKYSRTLQPGLNFSLPSPIEKVEVVNVSQVREESTLGEEMLTRDEFILVMDMTVQYNVKDAKDYLFQVVNPDNTLQQAAESALRQVVGDNDMDYVLLEGRAEIASETREILQEILDRYQTGLALTAINLKEVRPPPEVKAAFDDAIKAREDRETTENEAQAYANRVVPEARGRAARILQEAEAYRDSTIARATGEAERFNLLRGEYEEAPEVTRQRLYLETMEEVMGESPKVLVDVSQGNNVMYLPLQDIMNRTVPAVVQPRRETSVPTPVAPPTRSEYQRDTARRTREGRQ